MFPSPQVYFPSSRVSTVFIQERSHNEISCFSMVLLYCRAFGFKTGGFLKIAKQSKPIFLYTENEKPLHDFQTIINHSLYISL